MLFRESVFPWDGTCEGLEVDVVGLDDIHMGQDAELRA